MVVLCGAFTICKAQQSNTVNFTYDKNGNRMGQTFTSSGSKDRYTDIENRPSTSTINDIFSATKICLYPNPTSDNLTLAIQDKPNECGFLLRIATVSGSVIQEKVVSSDQETFDMAELPTGVYLFQLVSGKKTKVWKVIKQ